MPPSPRVTDPRPASALRSARRVRFGPYVFDRDEATLQREDERRALPPKPAALLDLLISRAGQLVTKDEILGRVWRDTHVGDAVIKVCVGQLRQALGDEAASPRFVSTEPRRGYRFVAELGEADPREPLEAALHDGLAGDATAAIERALRAAQRAEEDRDHATGAEHFSRALGSARFLCPGETALIADLTIRMGRALHRAGQTARARSALSEAIASARGLGDARLLARAALALGEGHPSATEIDEELVGALETALEQLLPGCESASEDLSRGASELVARLEARLAYALAPSVDATRRRRELAQSALRRAGDGEPGFMAWIHRYVLWACWGPDDDHGLRRRRSDQAVALAERDGAVDALLHALGIRFQFALESADVERADADLARYLDLVEGAGRPWFGWSALRMRVMRHVVTGEFQEAEQLLGENMARAGALEHPDVVGLFYAQLTAVRMIQGRAAEVAEFIGAHARPRAASVGWRCGLAWVHAELGNRREASAELRELVADDFAALPRNGFWTGYMTLLADAAADVSDRRVAARIYPKLLPFAEQCAILYGVTWFGSIQRPLGRLARLLGQEERAQRHFVAAQEVHRRADAKPWLERTRRELGEP